MKKTKIIAIISGLTLTVALCLMSACSSTSYSATIKLNGDSAQVTGSGAAVDGSTVTISAAGDYKLTGTLTDGQVVVNADGAVTLSLDGADITNTADDAIHIKSGTVTVELVKGSENTVTSGAQSDADGSSDTTTTTQTPTVTAAATAAAATTTAAPQTTDAAGTTQTTETTETTDTDDASGAALFSKDAVTVTGEGSLTVNGYINNGLAAKGGVTISSGTLTVNSTNDGVKSSDGAITVSGGTLKVTAGGDGVSAGTDLSITGGSFDITSGDGSESSGQGQMTPGGSTAQAQTQTQTQTQPGTTQDASAMPTPPNDMNGFDDSSDDTDDSASMKAIKCDGNMSITGGTFTINSTDHAIHASGAMDITGGTFTISSSAGKGISGHGNVTIDGQSTAITITKATEGIESKAVLTVNNGTLDITASDDGMNAGGGDSSFGMGGQTTASTTSTTSNTSDTSTTSDTQHKIAINGGTINIDASGDGIDSNGDLIIAGGTIIVSGPTNSGNGALDSGAESGGKCSVTGGTIIALGASGMAEGFDTNSTQYSFMYNFSSTVSAGTVVTVKDSDGNEIYSFTSTKDFSSVVFSSDKLQKDGVYTVTAGSQTTQITMSAIAVNSASTNAMGQGGGKGGMSGTAPTMPDGSTFDPSQMKGGKGGGKPGTDAQSGATSTTTN